MTLIRHVPPTSQPVELAELKQHLRIEDTDTVEDAILTAYLQAAIDHFDGATGILGRCLLRQTWQLVTDRPVPVDGRGCPVGLGSTFAQRGIRIELGPDIEVTDLEYVSGGLWVEHDLDDVWPTPVAGGRTLLVPMPGQTWPTADAVPGAWRVTFTAGAVSADEVPPAIRAAILLVAADLAQNRDGKTTANLVANPTVDLLVGPHRMVSV